MCIIKNCILNTFFFAFELLGIAGNIVNARCMHTRGNCVKRFIQQN